MPVLLHTPCDLPANGFDHWVVLGDFRPDLPPHLALPGQGHLLEEALEGAAGSWLELLSALRAAPWGRMAHTPAMAQNASDFGSMLAWSRLVAEWGRGDGRILVVCDDPWLFRHLRALPGVSAPGRPPALALAEWRLRLRGLAARFRVSLAALAACVRLGKPGGVHGGPVLLVYGHPRSMAEGEDAYFGNLMHHCPEVTRMLHVDCPPAGVRRLAGPRTHSLHGWGAPLVAMDLWRTRWRPKAEGPYAWLIRRAAAREGGTGSAAMIRWQMHCQHRWLRACRPSLVAWPWENHAWERDFVDTARSLGLHTVGYQHATVGRHEWNYRPTDQGDLPDRVVCAGVYSRDLLAEWGVPTGRLEVGGAWRFPRIKPLVRDPDGPVFVALPAQLAVATQMLAAIRPLAAAGWRFLVREHPMTPVGAKPLPGIQLSPVPLDQAGPVALVLFAATTVGVEALLAGLPALRFLPRGLVANDVVPAGLRCRTVDAESLENLLNHPVIDETLPPARLFGPVDIGWWCDLMNERQGNISDG